MCNVLSIFYHINLVLDYCLWQSFNATCPVGTTILMTHANYGRMRRNHCVNNEQINIGCHKV